MEPIDFSRGAKNLICVCVDQAEAYCFSGRMYHRFAREPEQFCEPGYLLAKIDTLLDWLDYPQRTLTKRTFRIRRHAPLSRKDQENMPKEELREIKEPTEEKGDLATFVVHVMYRQNATWQGSVLWAESGETQNFRSALELMELMNSALESKGQDAQQA